MRIIKYCPSSEDWERGTKICEISKYQIYISFNDMDSFD